MKRVKYVLDQNDRVLLQKFKINKNLQIKLVNLQSIVNTETSSRVSLIFSPILDLNTEEFGSKDPLNYAKRENKRFKCRLCPFSSAFKASLNRHSWIHSANRRFKCDNCSYTTNYNRYLKSHENSIHNKNPESRTRNYPCQLCTKSFFTMSELRCHLSSHTKEKRFLCQFCRTEFTISGNRNRHEIICNQNPKREDPVWVESQKRFECKLCSKKLLTNRELTVHIRGHTQEKPYQCEKCDYAAASASALKHHGKRRHNLNKIKNVACKLCPKLFVTKSELYQHIRTHTKESWSVCGFCKKRLACKSSLTQHMKVCKSNPKQSNKEWVSGQKKFKCELCEYASPYRSRLKRHLRIHAGTDSY